METSDSKNQKALEPIIRLDNVWKIYKMGDVEVPALRGMTLDIYPHEFVTIMGPSGSGKSTAMNMVGCLDVPTKGHIYLDGKDISKMNEATLRKSAAGRYGSYSSHLTRCRIFQPLKT